MRFPLIAAVVILVCATCTAGTINDAALNRPVTLSMKGEALSDVLKEVKNQTGVSLSVSNDIADQKATIFVDKKPAKEVLQGVATLFDYTWRTTTTGKTASSELIQTEEAKRRLMKRDRHLVDTTRINSSLAPTMQKITEYSYRTLDERRKLEDELTEKQKRLEALYNSDHSPTVTKENIEEYESIIESLNALMTTNNQTTYPVVLPLVRFYATIPKSATDSLISGKDLCFDSASPEQKWKIPAQYASDIIAAPRLGNQSFTGPGEDNSCPDAAKITDINVRFDADLGSSLTACIDYYTDENPSTPRCCRQLVDIASSHFNHLDAWHNAGFENYLPDADRTALYAKKVTITNSDLEKEERPTNGNRYSPFNRSTLLALLHKKTGVQIISDHYTDWRVYHDINSVPVSSILADYSDAYGYKMTTGWDGKYLYVRSSCPIEDDKAEIPNRLLRPLQKALARHGHYTLDQLASAAATFTVDQRSWLRSYYADIGLGDLGEWLYMVYEPHRFYGLLSPSERKQILAGRLHYSKLSGEQKRSLNECFRAEVDDESHPRLIGICENGKRIDSPGGSEPELRARPVSVSLRKMGLEDVEDHGPYAEVIADPPPMDGEPFPYRMNGYVRCEFYDLCVRYADGSTGHREIMVPIRRLMHISKPLVIKKHVGYRPELWDRW